MICPAGILLSMPEHAQHKPGARRYSVSHQVVECTFGNFDTALVSQALQHTPGRIKDYFNCIAAAQCHLRLGNQ